MQPRKEFGAHESAGLREVCTLALHNKPPAGSLARRVRAGVCVLRPVDWRGVVSESSGSLGQRRRQHGPAQRAPLGEAQPRRVHAAAALAVFVLAQLDKQRGLNEVSRGSG